MREEDIEGRYCMSAFTHTGVMFRRPRQQDVSAIKIPDNSTSKIRECNFKSGLNPQIFT